MSSTFHRDIQFSPAYDRRDSNPSKNYGIHGANMTWLLRGEKGVIQFCVHTNWYLPHVVDELDAKDLPGWMWRPNPVDIGYHSPVPMYEGDTPMSDECSILGGMCYYDGSSLGAKKFLDLLIEQGHEAVWSAMEEEYQTRFGSVEK